MNKTWTLSVVGAVVVSLLVFACITGAENKEAPKHAAWEYKLLTLYEVADVKSAWELLGDPNEANQGDAAATDVTDDGGAANAENNKEGFGALEELGKLTMARANRRIEDGLNRQGTEGWELATVCDGTFYFKRPKP